jgi:hypothetical protein
VDVNVSALLIERVPSRTTMVDGKRGTYFVMTYFLSWQNGFNSTPHVDFPLLFKAPAH